MVSGKKYKELAAEVRRLKEKEKKLEHDLDVYRQIFAHLQKQFESMKNEILRYRK